MSGSTRRVFLPAAVVICLLLATAPCQAQRGGPGPGAGAANTTLTTFETDDFSGAGICALCHSGLIDEGGNDVSNDADWRSTLMAHAAKDPLWQAKISAEVALNPHIQDIIEDKCSRCHMGMARTQALADGNVVEVLDGGFLDPANYLHAAAMDGVSCTLCHQVSPDKLGTPASFTGKYVIDTGSVPPDRLIYGPYNQPMQNPMRQNAGFLPTPGAHLTTSALCGSCHTLYTPVLDQAGDLLGEEFPEQTTYLEWAYSDIPRTCQDCHLPDAVGSVVISNRPPRLAPRTPFGQHHYVGGNSLMLNLLNANAADLGLTAEAAHFEATIARTLVQLQEDTAKLSVAATRAGGRLVVTVDVENQAGHKLPSGLPSRRAWLHLTVADAGGATLFESGKFIPGGAIEGNDADIDPSTYEPHYERISYPDQVQIYEPIMLTFEGDVTYTLLRALYYVKDNRLLPAGFDKQSAPADIAVYGFAAVDPDFTGGGDRVIYDIAAASDKGKLTVAVQLLYQTLSLPFVEDLSDTKTDLVDRFMALYNPAENVPVVLAETTISIR